MAHAHEESYRPAVTVNILPDNVFREIFAFCLSDIGDMSYDHSWHMTEWQGLVQVCQRWQQIIYGSPHYLDLRLFCSDRVPFRKNLRRWPEFPLTLRYPIFPDGDEGVNDLIAALEHRNRVHRLDLFIRSWDSGVLEVLEKMEVSLPVLTHLELSGPDEDKVYHISDNLLGNAAPCLQHLHLDGISFPNLPQLLLSARGLVSLQLTDIPTVFYGHYGHISPEAMVGGLAGLTRLRTLCIEFRTLQEYPNLNERLQKGRRPDPPMRAVLPALTEFVFSGEIKYLEDLVARIDMPSVEDIEIEIEFFPPWLDAVHELSQFIGRTANLELAQFRHAQVTFHTLYSQIKLDLPQGELHQVRFSLGVQLSESDTRRASDLNVLLPRMARVLGQLTALLSNVGHLSFDSLQRRSEKTNCLDNSKLLPLLQLFPTVEELHVSGVLAGHIATALENIPEERVTEVMPALLSLQLGDGNGPVVSTERFLSFRQLSGHPVAVVNINTQDQVIQT